MRPSASSRPADPGPWRLKSPETLAEEADIELLEPAHPLRPAASAEQIQTGAEVLRHAKQLLIIAGGGVIASKASAALQTLAEFLHAPVLTTAEGKGPCPIGTPWRWGPCVCVRIRSSSTWRRRMSCWRWARAGLSPALQRADGGPD